jgi:hypothetical protein
MEEGFLSVEGVRRVGRLSGCEAKTGGSEDPGGAKTKEERNPREKVRSPGNPRGGGFGSG